MQKIRLVLIPVLVMGSLLAVPPVGAGVDWGGLFGASNGPSGEGEREATRFQEEYQSGLAESLDPTWRGTHQEYLQRGLGWVLRVPVQGSFDEDSHFSHMSVPVAMEVLDGYGPREYALYLRQYFKARWDKITVEEAIFLCKRFDTEKMSPGEQDACLAYYGGLVQNYLTGLGARVVASHIDSPEPRSHFVQGFLRQRIRELGRSHSTGSAAGQSRSAPTHLLPAGDPGSVPELASDLDPEDLDALLREIDFSSRGSFVEEYFSVRGDRLTAAQARSLAQVASRSPAESEMILQRYHTARGITLDRRGEPLRRW